MPILDWSFNGPAPTDTQFDTVDINRQYDFWADFPLYPINVIADVNALLGAFYQHLYSYDVSLAPDPSKSPDYHKDIHGDTSYYFFETENLPLFGPLRTLGVPEALIDVVEPFFRVLVELGYDRSIPPWEPTPARLIPPLDPAAVVGDLVDAIGEGINNALAITGSVTPVAVPDATADVSPSHVDVATVGSDNSSMPSDANSVEGQRNTTPATEPANRSDTDVTAADDIDAYAPRTAPDTDSTTTLTTDPTNSKPHKPGTKPEVRISVQQDRRRPSSPIRTPGRTDLQSAPRRPPLPAPRRQPTPHRQPTRQGQQASREVTHRRTGWAPDNCFSRTQR